MTLIQLGNVLTEGNNSFKLYINGNELHLDGLCLKSTGILAMDIEKIAIRDNCLMIYLHDSILMSQLEDYGFSFEAGV